MFTRLTQLSVWITVLIMVLAWASGALVGWTIRDYQVQENLMEALREAHHG
jgi:uncharacterized protein YneF (UPF0154 family)